jgi:hypothetical protein
MGVSANYSDLRYMLDTHCRLQKHLFVNVLNTHPTMKRCPNNTTLVHVSLVLEHFNSAGPAGSVQYVHSALGKSQRSHHSLACRCPKLCYG